MSCEAFAGHASPPHAPNMLTARTHASQAAYCDRFGHPGAQESAPSTSCNQLSIGAEQAVRQHLRNS